MKVTSTGQHWELNGSVYRIAFSVGPNYSVFHCVQRYTSDGWQQSMLTIFYLKRMADRITKKDAEMLISGLTTADN